jgi:hypothetical protein
MVKAERGRFLLPMLHKERNDVSVVNFKDYFVVLAPISNPIFS